MNALDQIGVTVVESNGNARALLREIHRMLEALIGKGEVNSIDLSSLPLSPTDRQLLEETLGEGEVSAEVNSLGPTRVRESGIPGVWWVSHCNADGEVMSEFIEVTDCPEILLTPQEDMQDGLEALHALLFEANLKEEENHAG
jgi:hydrogenase-1 operon protein HyaF